jgi:hypothetical protein
VDVVLHKNWAVLYTQRLQVQPIGILISNISGSICGILGIFGFLMGLFEDNYIKIMSKVTNKLHLKRLQENVEAILEKNFSSSILEIIPFKPKRNSRPSRSLKYKYDTMSYESASVIPISSPEEIDIQY